MFLSPTGRPVFLGTGDNYPRGPAMVIGANRSGVVEKGFSDEQLLCVYFNEGVREKPVPGERIYWQGRWGELDLATVPVPFNPQSDNRGVRFTRMSYLAANPDFEDSGSDG